MVDIIVAAMSGNKIAPVPPVTKEQSAKSMTATPPEVTSSRSETQQAVSLLYFNDMSASPTEEAKKYMPGWFSEELDADLLKV